jgi:V8-like Glu-specific endopeptidase
MLGAGDVKRVPRGTSKVAPETDRTARIGALFQRDPSGNHFCTGSVVNSPHDDLVLTAAHCVYSGGRPASDLVFAPAYRDGQTPRGVWTVTRVVVDPRWAQSSDPDLDVAFLVVAPLNGKKVAEVLGGNPLGIDTGFDHRVRVTGYPSTADDPITCANKATEQSSTQLRIACTGYTGGTSGSPWLMTTRDDHNGQVIGVIGGYQQGGDTADVSYSPYFGDAVRQLYERAVADG